jgi:hypothetical protein
VLNVAVPLLNVPVPSVLVPSRNVTVPLGALALEPVNATVAVSKTDCPVFDGFGDAVKAVVVAIFTGKLKTADVLVTKFVSPA